MSGLILALIVTTGFAILFKKLPQGMQAWLEKKYILLDIILCWAAFTMLGFTLMGIFAAAWIALFVSAYLWWRNNFKSPPPAPPKKKQRECSLPIWLAAHTYNWFKGPTHARHPRG